MKSAGPPGLEKEYERKKQLPPACKGGSSWTDGAGRLAAILLPAFYQRVGELPINGKLYLYGNDLILLNHDSKAIMGVARDDEPSATTARFRAPR
jgi:hypothetical protein